MLKAFRENFKHLKWVLWAVIAVFVVFVFVDWGMGTTRGSGEQDTAARVGSFKVTTSEFQREYRNTEDRYKQLYGKSFSPELLKAMRLGEQVINSLIDRHFLTEEAARLGLSATDEDVTGRVLRMKDNQGRPIFVKDGAFVGEATYKRMLAGASLTPSEFEEQTRSQILLEKLTRFYTEAVFMGDDEVEAEFASKTVKAKISFVQLLSANVPAPAVSDAEAEAYFKEHASSYLQAEKRKVKYLFVDSAKVRGSVTVTDADVAAEYNANLDTYKKQAEIQARHILYKSDGTPAQDGPAKAKAEAALKKLRAGADFAQLASLESEDPGSKASGGDLGSFPRGRMVKEFEDAAFGAEAGVPVGPVKSPFGYHVIQVVSKSGERVQPLFEVSGTIRQRLSEQRAVDETRRLARELFDRLRKVSEKPSDDEMRKLAGPRVTFAESDFLSRTDVIPAIGPSPQLAQALFSLQPGEVAEPVTVPRGEVVAKLAEIRKPGSPQLAEVKSRVVADLAKKKQDDAALQAFRDAAGPTPSLEAAAAKLKLKVETPETFGKAGPVPGLGSSKELLDAVFAANVGDVKGPILVGQGVVLCKVIEKTAFDRVAFDGQKEQIRDRLKNLKSGQLLQSLLARRRAEAKVDVNKELLARFGASS